MKTTKTHQNDIKRLSKNGTAFLFTALFTLSISAKINSDTLTHNATIEKQKLEKTLMHNSGILDIEALDINAIEVIELEEDIVLGFDTSNYLPEGFNALQGKNDLDWTAIALIELEEDVTLGFDTSNYLPVGFNALKGKNDLDWSTIEVIDIEEDIEINFDTKAHLPKGFNPFNGMATPCIDSVVTY